MIHDALALIATELNKHLSLTTGDEAELVVVGNLFNANRDPIERRADKLTMFVANIALNEIAQSARSSKTGDPRSGHDAHPLCLDLDVMLVSNFYGETYTKGLQVLSQAIQFFHMSHVFSKSNIASIPRSLKRIAVEMAADEDVDKPEPWKYLTPEHRPFVLYKLKIVAA